MGIRSALDNATQTYLAAHFHDGVASIFSKGNGVREFIIQVVANKYNPSNYWCVVGTWAHSFSNISITGLVVGDQNIRSALTKVKSQEKYWLMCIITSKAM